MALMLREYRELEYWGRSWIWSWLSRKMGVLGSVRILGLVESISSTICPIMGKKSTLGANGSLFTPQSSPQLAVTKSSDSKKIDMSGSDVPSVWLAMCLLLTLMVK